MPDDTLRLPTRPASGGSGGGRSGGGSGSGDGRAGGARDGRSGGRNRRSRRRGRIALLLAAGVFAAGLVAVWAWWNGSVGPVAVREHCTSTASGTVAELDPEQAGNAAVIAAIARKRGMPARAATIGIATAIQESKLRNIDYGDRDSLGLFQQRPSQGWGSREEVTDPVYATNAFYDVLAKVEGYETMEITKVAQEVQRSAFPEAYADHEPEARVIASALSGYSPAGFSCVLKQSQAPAESAGGGGLTPRARELSSAAKEEAGRDDVTPVGPAGTTLRFAVPRADGDSNAWVLAHWAVARAAGLDVVRVEVADRRWDRAGSTDGWTAREAPLPDGTVVVTVA